MNKKYLVTLTLSLLFIWPLAAIDTSKIETGFLFSTSDISLDLEGYEGGLGIKWLYENMALRTSAHLLLDYSTDNDPGISEQGWGLGTTFEWHFKEGRVSPYTGFGLCYDHSSEKIQTDSTNWTEDIMDKVTFGPILGGELTVLDNVSLFAEYQLAMIFEWPTKKTTTDNNTKTTKEDEGWLLDLGLGNQGMLGIVIYF
ncbi:outer membrane beta-barrel protein [Spirochaeta cellobiosiphila]|uniref:outer membrane beta-barrel protein n=1 Tax=Spirochaeta cellobiosiphila TaxID=504483 RepID=UPI000414AD13|nr:outer membrane beta-barrel protein [Spirochaeta cellobiosiphila]